MAFFVVFYVIFALAWLIGIAQPSGRVDSVFLAGFRITSVAFLSLVVFFILISGTQMGGLIFAGIPIFFLIPMLVAGVGLTVSTMAKSAFIRGFRVAATAIGLLSFFAPLGAVTHFWITQWTQEEQRRSDLAAFHAGNLVGILGDQHIEFPASPQIETIHRCPDVRVCYTKFRRSGDSLHGITDDSDGGHYFEEIELIPLHETCEGQGAPINACLRKEDLKAWCDERQDWAQRIWCETQLEHSIAFSSKSEHRLLAENWIKENANSLGKDYFSQPIEIECHSSRDRTRSNNPHISRLCRVRYKVAADVTATIRLDGFENSELDSLAEMLIVHANELWASLVE